MPKPSGAVWTTVRRIWYDRGLASGREERGAVLAALDCGHWREYRGSRAPSMSARVSCKRCGEPAPPVRVDRHGVRVRGSRWAT